MPNALIRRVTEFSALVFREIIIVRRTVVSDEILRRDESAGIFRHAISKQELHRLADLVDVLRKPFVILRIAVIISRRRDENTVVVDLSAVEGERDLFETNFGVDAVFEHDLDLHIGDRVVQTFGNAPVFMRVHRENDMRGRIEHRVIVGGKLAVSHGVRFVEYGIFNAAAPLPGYDHVLYLFRGTERIEVGDAQIEFEKRRTVRGTHKVLHVDRRSVVLRFAVRGGFVGKRYGFHIRPRDRHIVVIIGGSLHRRSDHSGIGNAFPDRRQLVASVFAGDVVQPVEIRAVIIYAGRRVAGMRHIRELPALPPVGGRSAGIDPDIAEIVLINVGEPVSDAFLRAVADPRRIHPHNGHRFPFFPHRAAFADLEIADRFVVVTEVTTHVFV